MSAREAEPARVPHLPGPIGRVARLVFGVGLAQLVVSLVLLMVDGFSGWPEDGDVDLAIGIGLTLWLAPTIYDIGLQRSLGHGWHGVAIAGGGVAALLGLLGGEPGTAATYWMLAWISFTLGWLAISFVLAAVLRTPGCEMRALPHLWARLTNTGERVAPCPGPLQPLDEWEARATGRAVAYTGGTD